MTRVGQVWIGLLALGLALEASASAAVATSLPDAPWHSWTHLRMHARSAAVFSGQFELTRSGSGESRQLETAATARVFGAVVVRSRTETTYRATSGAPLHHLSVSKKHGRRYVFGEKGYSVEKIVPPAGAARPPQQWLVRTRAEFDLPSAPVEGSFHAVFDYSTMLLRLASERLTTVRDEVTLHVATARGPHAYVIRIDDVRARTRTYRDAGGTRRSVSVREIRLAIRPQGDEDDDSGFMNMRGETEVWVEASSKTPLEIVGRIPGVPGKVRLEMVELH